MSARRRSLLAGARGDVIEVGAGSGANLVHYPSTVRRVTAVEPEPFLRAAAARAASGVDVPIDVVPGTGEHLETEDASVDIVVFALVLCSVRDVQACLTEAQRVLRPGGEVRFLEHGIADSAAMARLQQVLDATVYPALAGGCHLSRDPRRSVTEAGFRITAEETFLWPQARTPISFHVSGTAVLAGDGDA